MKLRYKLYKTKRNTFFILDTKSGEVLETVKPVTRMEMMDDEVWEVRVTFYVNEIIEEI